MCIDKSHNKSISDLIESVGNHVLHRLDKATYMREMEKFFAYCPKAGMFDFIGYMGMREINREKAIEFLDFLNK